MLYPAVLGLDAPEGCTEPPKPLHPPTLSSCAAQVEERKNRFGVLHQPQAGGSGLVTDLVSFPGTFSIPVPPGAGWANPGTSSSLHGQEAAAAHTESGL